MDKIIKALGISIILTVIADIIYMVMFFGDVFDSPVQLNSEKVYYMSGTELEGFLSFMSITLGIIIILTVLLIELEVTFVKTLKRIIRVDEIEEDER